MEDKSTLGGLKGSLNIRMATVQVLMATNRPDTLDPALLRPGRLDRKVEFGLPDLESRTQIFQIHTRTMNCERDIRFELLSRSAYDGACHSLYLVQQSWSCANAIASLCPVLQVCRGVDQLWDCHTWSGRLCFRPLLCEQASHDDLARRLCPNSTGADIRSVCTEAGMFAIRARRKTVTEKDFLDAVNKVGPML